jgi:2-polyprenyl-6-methoxyphenol hydroxylase-like FAD-dependent oxidoreductase
MDVLVIGSGPVGLVVAGALARRGHRVTSVDRDPGPAPDGWQRRGVMQFEHAHGFRPQVSEVLRREWPEAYDAWLGLGAEEVQIRAGDEVVAVIMRSRRPTLERALRRAAADLDGLDLRVGHVDGFLVEAGAVRGASVDGDPVLADLVVDSSGRASRLTPHPPELGGDCGLAYVDRMYQLRPGADSGPMDNFLGAFSDYDGYQSLLFPHEGGHFSVVIVRPTADADLKDLRHEVAFDAACRAIPSLGAWTDPERSAPTSGVLPGGPLRNTYHRQPDLRGLVRVGDTVATTTPTRGRGVAMGCLQVSALTGMLDDGATPDTVGAAFGAWCDEQVRPWVVDHIEIDDGTVARWAGRDVDPEHLTSDRIAAAVEADPRIGEYAGGYFAMTALPSSLAPAEPLARAVYESGWRPRLSEGPSRDELVALIRAR